MAQPARLRPGSLRGWAAQASWRTRLSDKKRQYRKFTPQQKLELVMASWRGEKSIAELCREHSISESLLRRWREQVLDAGMERFAAGEQRTEATDLRRKGAPLGRGPGRQTDELEGAGGILRGWGGGGGAPRPPGRAPPGLRP